MKKLVNYLLITVVTFSLFACGNDDDVAPAPTIVGTWKLINFTENGVPSFDPNECWDQETWIFYEDLTAKAIYYYDNPSGTGCLEDIDEEENGIYQIDGNQLTISDGTFEETATFTLSETQLVVTALYEGDTFISTFQRLN